jgi:N-acetylmuramoyl-L-alanine amidase CwlA
MVTPIPIKGHTLEGRNRICAISAMMFQHIINNTNRHYGKVEQLALSLNESNTALQEPKDDDPNIEAIIPPEYHQYLKIDEKVNADKLPGHQLCNHKIPLEDGFQPPFRQLYSLSCLELEDLK